MTRAINIAQSGGNNFTMRNRIINGDMRIDQRNAGASSTPPTGGTTASYTLDRWTVNTNISSAVSIQQNAGSVTPPFGFSNYLGATSLAATSVGASNYSLLEQRIEGFNFSDLAWGTASAQPVTISFWVRSSLTGTFSGSLQTSATRFYGYTYTINTANTWEQKTVTIIGDTVGATASGNTTSVYIRWSLAAGSSVVGSAGSWGGSTLLGVTGQTNFLATNGATFYITGVQLEAGTTATPFENRPYGMELALCQRYYYRLSGGGNTRHAIGGNGSLSQGFPTVFTKVTMRTQPSFSYSALSDFNIECITVGGSATPTSLSFNAGNLDTITIICQSSGSTTNTGIQLNGTGTNAWTAYSAEL
jgi:hypothetical protein